MPQGTLTLDVRTRTLLLKRIYCGIIFKSVHCYISIVGLIWKELGNNSMSNEGIAIAIFVFNYLYTVDK